jgi:hypothetical protein
MMTNANEFTDTDKTKAAYALNLCLISISQIIDSKDIVVLKQERESILNNLNLQNFVKHPALLEVIKRTLDTVTYLEIQAGDLTFIEKDYQHNMKNAIWSAVPSPGALFAGGSSVSIAIAVAIQIGTSYMNYRRNKSNYELSRDKSKWELKRFEIEQLEGLRSALFETAWHLSTTYNFDDKLRLTDKQVSRYSAAVLESDPLRRYERLDVISDKFMAFPPFWYYKGNAAMEVYNSNQYGGFKEDYKEKALQAFNEFHKRNFEMLREDIVAASCCLEHVSLLPPNDVFINELLRQAIRFAGDNYDVLQQSILINIKLNKIDEVIKPLRELVANNYNPGVNGILLSRIYYLQNSRKDYDKLCAIIGKDNVLEWASDMEASEELKIVKSKEELREEFLSMTKRIMFMIKTDKLKTSTSDVFTAFNTILAKIAEYADNNRELAKSLESIKSKFKQAFTLKSDLTIREFDLEAKELCKIIDSTKFSLKLIEDKQSIIEIMRKSAV